MFQNHPRSISFVRIHFAVESGPGSVDSGGLLTAEFLEGRILIRMTVDDLIGAVGATVECIVASRA